MWAWENKRERERAWDIKRERESKRERENPRGLADGLGLHALQPRDHRHRPRLPRPQRGHRL